MSVPATSPIIRAKGVSHAFGPRPVLEEISFEAHAGTITGILGPNGSGKTTLLRVLLGVVVPRRGELWLGGRSYDEFRGQDRSAFARRVALVPQDVSVTFPFLVREVVLLGRLPHLPPPGFFPSPARLGLGREEDERHAEEALAACGLSALADRPIAALSGGERRRVFLARALAQDADVLLLDEPTGALDVGQQLALLATLRRLAAGGKTIVLVGHDLDLLDDLCDRAVLLRDGRALAAGPTAEVLTEENLRAAFELDVQIAHVANRDGEQRRIFLPRLLPALPGEPSVRASGR